VRKLIDRLIKYLHKTYLSHWVVLGGDVFISVICSFAAYVYICHIIGMTVDYNDCMVVLVVSVLSVMFGSLMFNTYRNVIRYSKARDLWRITCCVSFKTICIAFVLIVILKWNGWNLKQDLLLAILDGMLTLILMTGVRITMIVVYESLLKMDNKKAKMRILIYGLDEKSVALEARLHNSLSYRVVGFYTLNFNIKSKAIAGLPIYDINSEDEFGALVERKKIQGILFARLETTRSEENRLLKYCKKYGIRTLIAPTISEADENGKFYQSVRPIKIEDLLGREEISISMPEVIAEFEGKVVLVTGAAGSIGSELCRQIAQLGIKQLLLYDSAETPLHNTYLEFTERFPDLNFISIIGDVRVKERLRMTFELYHPEIVVHAAAYKHVPLMEENPCEAVLVNAIGTRNLADIAVEFGAKKMVMVSTDKAVNPTNVMGASKRLAEIYVQSLGCAIKEGDVQANTQFVTTRFGNVLGSNGSVIHRFREQIESGGPVTVTDPDIIRYFMSIPEACRLILEAATMGNGDEIFVFEMGNPVKIVDLATKMIELAGYKHGEIKIKYTGLRPGEKLYEELLSLEENTMPTSNNKIKIAQVRRYKYDAILESFDMVEYFARNVEAISAVSLMKQIIPEFISKNSKFAELDKVDVEHIS
jgi:Predicted nucleoside-diphosphate sugar epimerases